MVQRQIKATIRTAKGSDLSLFFMCGILKTNINPINL